MLKVEAGRLKTANMTLTPRYAEKSRRQIAFETYTSAVHIRDAITCGRCLHWNRRHATDWPEARQVLISKSYMLISKAVAPPSFSYNAAMLLYCSHSSSPSPIAGKPGGERSMLEGRALLGDGVSNSMTCVNLRLRFWKVPGSCFTLIKGALPA